SSKFKQIIEENWRVLRNDVTLPPIFQNPPMFCYKRNKNRRDLLVNTDPVHCYSKETSLQNLGCYRCLGCVTCGHMIPGKTFSHPHTGTIFHIRHRLTCTSDFVIYKLTCPCGLTYIGKTDLPLRERIRNHRSSIRTAYRDKKSELPVAKHFLELGHSLPSMKLMAIDQIPLPRRGGDRKKMLLQRELFWIRTLQTVYPNGLNEKYSLSVFL
ncbi:Hypothetical predicted protein, partial [Pelobates cultripes]